MKIDDNLIKSILLHEIILCIAGFGLKRLINYIGLKYRTCLNKFMHGRNLDDKRINEMPCNMSCNMPCIKLCNK